MAMVDHGLPMLLPVYLAIRAGETTPLADARNLVPYVPLCQEPLRGI